MDMEAPVDPSEGSGGRVSVVKGRVEGDKKKQSFKAMMKKHKDEV